jgi:hypothetical protein
MNKLKLWCLLGSNFSFCAVELVLAGLFAFILRRAGDLEHVSTSCFRLFPILTGQSTRNDGRIDQKFEVSQYLINDTVCVRNPLLTY